MSSASGKVVVVAAEAVEEEGCPGTWQVRSPRLTLTFALEYYWAGAAVNKNQ